MNELTDKQKLIYNYIKSEIKTKGYPPSVREICALMNLRSTSTVHTHLAALSKKGYIQRSGSKNRSIKILDENFYGKNLNFISVPVLGKVTAGIPILAVENIEEYFPISFDYVKDDEVFMLRVVGDSMLGAGINDRDLVLVKKQETANNGDIVVALIDDSATVKTFIREDKHIKLMPHNDKYEPIITKNVSIIGKVIGLFRKFA